MKQPTRHSLYTEATGNGPLDITVTLLPHTRLADWRSADLRYPLLATVTGGTFDLNRSDLGLPEWRLSARDGKTTDFEHDAARFIDMTVINPILMSSYDGQIAYVGMLTEARLWPLDVDPGTSGDGDTEARFCDGWPGHNGEHEPHPMAAYIPPERDDVYDLMPHFVVIETEPNLDYVERVAQWRTEQRVTEHLRSLEQNGTES